MSPYRPWRRALRALCLTLAGAALPLAVQAQANYPDRPLRIVVPFTAGGSSDIQGRLLAEHLGKLYGQSVVVENRCLLYTSPSPRDQRGSRMPSSA